MTSKKQKKQTNQYVDQNPVEAFRDLGGGIAKSLVDDVVKGSATGLWEQLLGTGSYKEKHSQGELIEGQELDLHSLKESQSKPDIEAGIDYRREILRGSEQVQHVANKETEVKIQEILVAIKQLAHSTKELEVQFKEVVVEQRIEKGSKYHLNFFEWILSVLRLAKMRVEDSSNWLSVFSNKKKQQKYWGMFKKHGTTFGLSNERVVATQTG